MRKSLIGVKHLRRRDKTAKFSVRRLLSFIIGNKLFYDIGWKTKV